MIALNVAKVLQNARPSFGNPTSIVHISRPSWLVPPSALVPQMLFIFALVHFFHITSYAAPLMATIGAPDNRSVDPFNPVILTTCMCPDTSRSIFDIVWSCSATLFACSWVSVHPNIAPGGESWWKRALRRLELMIWVLLTPELILMWAIRQWYGARELAKTYKSKGWTKTHGYFIQMGGFMLYKGGEPDKVLTPRNFEHLLSIGSIEFPTLTEEEICDRSKSDGLSKTLVIGQTSWFVAQCVAREFQGLDITELELVTVAFALLNGVMYFLWWNKPLDVQCCVPVHMLDTPKKCTPIAKPERIKLTLRGFISSQIILAYDKWKVNVVLPCRHLSSNIKARPLHILKAVITSPMVALLLIGRRLEEMVRADHWYDHLIHKPNIPLDNHIDRTLSSFFAHFKMYEITLQVLWLSVVTSTIAVLFGTIHCIGWYFVFPSYPELMLWRISSVLITGIPIFMVLPIILRFQAKHHIFFGHRFVNYISNLLQFPAMGVLPIYIIARLYLLVEALLALRHLPPGAYDVVSWSSFIPHV